MLVFRIEDRPDFFHGPRRSVVQVRSRVRHVGQLWHVAHPISSLVKSLVKPCWSFGLKTVQISSMDRADPSCRYGPEYATLGSCGTSIIRSHLWLSRW